jgi:hypothetical protein
MASVSVAQSGAGDRGAASGTLLSYSGLYRGDSGTLRVNESFWRRRSAPVRGGQQLLEAIVMHEVRELGCGAHHLCWIAEIDRMA